MDLQHFLECQGHQAQHPALLALGLVLQLFGAPVPPVPPVSIPGWSDASPAAPGMAGPQQCPPNPDQGSWAGGDPQVLQYSHHSIFWERILLIFATQRIFLEPEGVCLIHHACSAHNTGADEQNILK